MTTVSLDAESKQLLRDLTAELRRLCVAIAGRSGSHVTLRTAALRALEKLLPAIEAVVSFERDVNFTVNELFKHAELNEPTCKALREELTRLGSNRKKIGRLLINAARAAAPIAGFQVKAVGKDRNVRLFSISKHPETLPP